VGFKIHPSPPLIKEGEKQDFPLCKRGIEGDLSPFQVFLENRRG